MKEFPLITLKVHFLSKILRIGELRSHMPCGMVKLRKRERKEQRRVGEGSVENLGFVNASYYIQNR